MRALNAVWIDPLLSAVYQSQDTWAVLQERWAAAGVSTVVVVGCWRALRCWQTAEVRLVHVCAWRWCVVFTAHSLFGWYRRFCFLVLPRFLRYMVLSVGFALGFLCPLSRRNRWVRDGILRLLR